MPDIPVQSPVVPAEPVQIPERPENLQTDSFLYQEKDGALREIRYEDIGALLWTLGMAAMVVAAVISYFRLKYRVREACLLKKGCYECPGLDTAFVLGFFPAKIYLPMGLTDREKALILDHENTHIARYDHWFKVLGYGILSIHWFNPLVWLGYGMLCRDMELACDEHVIRYMDLDQRKDYSAALLSCGGHTARIAACPVAFGESNPKKRILNVLNYKRPSFWICMMAVIAAVFVAVCLLTSPESQTEAIPETEPQEFQNLQDTEEMEYIAMCRDALVDIQSREQYHISETIGYSLEDQEYNRNYATYWRDGKDYLLESYITELRTNVDFLYYDGTLYLRKLEESSQVIWNRIEGGAGYCCPWLCLLDWDEETITFEGTAMEGDELKVCVTAHGTPHALGLNDVQEYQILFFFDSQCNLIRAIMGAEQNGTRVVSDLTIENTLASNIRTKLKTVASQRPDDIPMRPNEGACTDPNCTDTTHNHSGIACTVEHCTNPAHGHHQEHDDHHH